MSKDKEIKRITIVYTDGSMTILVRDSKYGYLVEKQRRVD
jgi:hypothetical protein